MRSFSLAVSSLLGASSVYGGSHGDRHLASQYESGESMLLARGSSHILERHLVLQDDTADKEKLHAIVANCFVACVDQQMTAAQCEAYIEGILGQDLEFSVIPQLELVVSTPRTPAVKSLSYWYIGIPTNLDGQVECDMAKGVIKYYDPWETSKGVFAIPETNCFGMDANKCCDSILDNIAKAGIPLQDTSGNCLSCWVHQEPLTPVPGEGGTVMYVNHEVEGESCVARKLTTEEVEAKDKQMNEVLAKLIARIDNVAAQGATCAELETLQRDLLLWGRAEPHAMKAIGSLFCGYTCIEGAIPKSLISTLGFIKAHISGEVHSDVNELIIYTDREGLVMDPPKIGGSRADLDYDRNDTACEEDDAIPPLSGDTPLTFSNGTEIPMENGVCDAGALSDQSSEGGECSACRHCLARECDWTGDTTCRRLVFGFITGTPEQWLACLETNGVTAHLTNEDKPAGFDNWCHCALKCQDYCLKEDLTYFKDPRERECTAEDMSKRSEKNEQCHSCRLCLQQECTSWPRKHWCSFLLKGQRNGRPEQWLACLESDGTSDVLENGIEGEGNRDTWSECGRKCDEICVKEVIDRTSTENPICTPEDLALRSAKDTDVCFFCRQCIIRKCDYWRAQCELMATGQVMGSPEEWQKCFTHCGGGLRKNRELTSTLEDESGIRVGWCDCARECDSKCHHVLPEDDA